MRELVDVVGSRGWLSGYGLGLRRRRRCRRGISCRLLVIRAGRSILMIVAAPTRMLREHYARMQ
jgi:hypothetical protein